MTSNIVTKYFPEGEIPEKKVWKIKKEKLREELQRIHQREELKGMVDAMEKKKKYYELKYPGLASVFKEKGWEVREFYKCVGNGDCPHKGVLPRASNSKISEWRSDHARRCIIKIGTDRYAYQYWECCGHTCNSWCKGEKVAVIEL